MNYSITLSRKKYESHILFKFTKNELDEAEKHIYWFIKKDNWVCYYLDKLINN